MQLLKENDVMFKHNTRPYIKSDSNHLRANTVLINKDIFNELDISKSLGMDDNKSKHQFKSKISLNEKNANEEYVLAKIISCSLEDKSATDVPIYDNFAQNITNYKSSTENREINEDLTDNNAKFDFTKSKSKKYGIGSLSFKNVTNNLNTTDNGRYKTDYNTITTDMKVISDFVTKNLTKYMNMQLASGSDLFYKKIAEKILKKFNELSRIISKQSNYSYYKKRFNVDNNYIQDLKKVKLLETSNITYKAKESNKRVKRNVNPMLSETADKDFNFHWENNDVNKMLEREAINVDTNNTTTETSVPLLPRRMLAVAPTPPTRQTQIETSNTTKDIKQAYFPRAHQNLPYRRFNFRGRGLMSKYGPRAIFPRQKHMRLVPLPGENKPVIDSDETFNIKVRSRLNIPQQPILTMTTDDAQSFLKTIGYLGVPREHIKEDLPQPNSLIASGRRSMKSNITIESIPKDELKQLFEDPFLSDIENAIGTKQSAEETTPWESIF